MAERRLILLWVSQCWAFMDADGVPSFRANDHALHYMIRSHGNRRPDFFQAQINGDYWKTPSGVSIATGILLALVMFRNVWFVIWPAQKRVTTSRPS